MAGTRTLPSEPVRSTAYYYGDLERLKRPVVAAGEYVNTSDVIQDIPAREVPPLRDRQWSLPEYSTPENSRKGETYSTAGTFPMPEPKEKEPLLAELELVGRLPLTQLESGPGVRRSRSWYLCCPEVGEEEASRDSSWRYSSLRPVTQPPRPGLNGLSLIATQSSSRTDDLVTLRSERDALARALAAERQRAACQARAHDARLAELHGVIAELVRRRAQDKHARAIPEEEVSDECESTTQPAGDLDLDGDRSKTEQNESSSMLSPCSLPTPQEKVDPLPDDATDTSGCDPAVATGLTLGEPPAAADEASLNLSEKDSDLALSNRCQSAGVEAGASSCEREHGSAEAPRVATAEPGRCGSREAKLASRVRLKRTEETDSNQLEEEAWCTSTAERLAQDVCAQADLREALLAATQTEAGVPTSLRGWQLRCSRLQADAAVLQCALARAADTAHRLYCACCVQESVCVRVCLALRAADRALEAYDVLLALAESDNCPDSTERACSELVAGQLLARLDAAPDAASLSSPLLSPGPWLQHASTCVADAPPGWDEVREARLRGHAARLKAETVALRADTKPELFSYHDISTAELPSAAGSFSMADMEAAVLVQEVLAAKEARACTETHTRTRSHAGKQMHANARNTSVPLTHDTDYNEHKKESRGRRRHWLETQASETDL